MAWGLSPGLRLRSTHAALTKKEFTLSNKRKSSGRAGFIKGWLIQLFKDVNKNPGSSLPAQVGPQLWLHPQADSKQLQWWVAHPESTQAKQRPQLPWLQGKMQLSTGEPSRHIFPFHWTESDHMANPEPITRKGWKPNKPNPGPRVWPFPSYKGPRRRGGPCPKLRLCEEEGNGSCKTSNSIHKQAFWPGQDAHPAKTGRPEDKPNQKVITSAFTV